MVWVALGLLLPGASGATPPPAVVGGPSAALLAPAGQALACTDFRRQPDGSWSPRRPVTIGGMTLTPAMSFSRGVSFGGVDVGAALDAHCRSPRG